MSTSISLKEIFSKTQSTGNGSEEKYEFSIDIDESEENLRIYYFANPMIPFAAAISFPLMGDYFINCIWKSIMILSIFYAYYKYSFVRNKKVP